MNLVNQILNVMNSLKQKLIEVFSKKHFLKELIGIFGLCTANRLIYDDLKLYFSNQTSKGNWITKKTQ